MRAGRQARSLLALCRRRRPGLADAGAGGGLQRVDGGQQRPDRRAGAGRLPDRAAPQAAGRGRRRGGVPGRRGRGGAEAANWPCSTCRRWPNGRQPLRRGPGLGARATTHGGNFFADPLPDDADVISLVRVVHDHDDDRVRELSGQRAPLAAPGGTLLVAEPMSGTPEAAPCADAYFGFYLLAMGTGRARDPANPVRDAATRPASRPQAVAHRRTDADEPDRRPRVASMAPGLQGRKFRLTVHMSG